MNDDSPVLLEVDGEIVTITLNRPAALNSIDHPMALALHRSIVESADVPGARAVVLRGAGRSFCGGGDIAAMHAHRADMPAFIERMIDAFHAGVMALHRSRLPVIASVHGAVAGGGFSLALACDLVIATRGTRFVVAYPQLGAPADGGLSYRLSRQLGAARAFEMLTGPEPLPAENAMALGLINGVVDGDTADAEARRRAHGLAALPRQSVEELKQLVAAQSDEALEAQLAREKAAFLRCAATEDFARRVDAFVSRATRRARMPDGAAP